MHIYRHHALTLMWCTTAELQAKQKAAERQVELRRVLDAQKQEVEAKRAAELGQKVKIAQQQVCPTPRWSCAAALLPDAVKAMACSRQGLLSRTATCQQAAQHSICRLLITTSAQEEDVQRFKAEEAKKKAERAGAMEHLKASCPIPSRCMRPGR